MDVLKFDGRRVLGESVEHAAGTDRGELLSVANPDQFRARALYEVCEIVEALVVGHPGLIEKDGRVGANVDCAGLGSCDERVEGECVSRECGAVGAQSLGG